MKETLNIFLRYMEESTKYLYDNRLTSRESITILYVCFNYNEEIVRMNIIVSACLLGVDCRYCGDSCKNEGVLELGKEHNLIPVCPEQLGGLPTPRVPSERKGEYIVGKDGTDVTEAFSKGAKQALYISELYRCETAILKKNSPSCGFGLIYDGTFSGNKVEGNGVTAELLANKGIRIFNEDNYTELIR